MTVVLSGFADEISPGPRIQLATLAAESISHLELRSAWSVNVADFTDRQVAAFRAVLDEAGVRVSAIGSPIGKIRNEKEIYGDIPSRCAGLITAVGWPALQATFDPANFVQCGVRPFSDAYGLLRPHLARAGRYGGFSGPREFRRASQALKFLLNEASIPWQ